jgi:Tfp pilus assembly protein PilX
MRAADLCKEMSFRRAHDQDGQALPLTLLALLVLSAITAAVLTGSALNHRSSLTSQQAKQAFALAEQGLADAEGTLYTAVAAGCSNSCVPSSIINADTGTIEYSGSLSGEIWTLTGTGTVGAISRTVSEQADIPPPVVTRDPTIWNYLYVNSTSAQPGTPPNGCPANTNLWLQGGSQIKVPLYTPGNFCITGGSTFTGSDLEVGGTLTVPDSGSSIGSKTSPIAKLGAVTCTYQKSGSWHTCVKSSSAPNSSTVWASVVNTSTAPSLSLPSFDLSALYATQKAANKSSGCGTLLDNDTTLNKSDGTVNLFPTNTSYTCTITKDGNTIGSMSWNANGSWSVGTLSISGTVVVDGSLDLSGGMAVEYTGGGTIYFTGTVKIEGGSSICGGGSGTNHCSGWDPGDWNNPAKATQCAASGGCNVLVLVASCWNNSTGTSFVSGTSPSCVDLTGGTTTQAGIYSTQNFTLEGGSVDQGPVLANTMVVAGGTNILQMLPFNNLPAGTPTQTTTVTPPPGAPTNWSG